MIFYFPTRCHSVSEGLIFRTTYANNFFSRNSQFVLFHSIVIITLPYDQYTGSTENYLNTFCLSKSMDFEQCLKTVCDHQDIG